MTSECVTSTCSVGSSDVTPRESLKSWNGELDRSRVRRTQIIRRAEPNIPLDGAAPAQPSAATLTDQEPGERRRQTDY